MRERTTRIATAVNQQANGEGLVVATRTVAQQRDQLEQAGTSASARFFLNVTALTGSTTPTMLVSIVHVVDGVDIEVGTFVITSGTGAQNQTIVIEACPSDLKAKWVEGGTVTDFDATVDCMRF